MKLRGISGPIMAMAFVAAAICLFPAGLMVWALLKDAPKDAMPVVLAALHTIGIMLVGGALSMAAGLTAALYIFLLLPVRWRPTADMALYCLAGVSPVVFAMLTILLWKNVGLSYASLLFAVTISTFGFSARYLLIALSEVPSALLDSAGALGLTGLKSLRRVLIPSARRGIVGAALHTMARVGALAAVLNMIGGRTYLTGLLAVNGGGDAVSAAILTGLCLSCYLAGNHAAKRRGHA